ncbi:hypothetical protein BVC71_05830 [Marivivens niveibacter]|uniref:TVP38/TMEM64 family membrane protein n=1 Tax=Marivivens niveibacter TaxID=1930667 RepID=A0A251WZL4_9RHOB|nr:VTT domain-containing protein [Marivivens niveibacter]OUD09373.1 hypothetical protein BVC71_05830 [Marivivens niveibacter]
MALSHPFLRRMPLILIVLGVVAAAWLLRGVVSFETLKQNRDALIGYRDAAPILSVAVFIGIYAMATAFSIPGATIITLTGGFLFNTFPGALFNITGATIGAVILFLAARWGLGDRLAAKMDVSQGRVKKIKEGIDANQWSMLFLIRLVPAVPFFVANLIPAFVGVPLHRFVVSTALGIVPGAVVYTSVGAGLGAVFDRGGTPDLGIIFEPAVFWPLIGLSCLAVLPVIIKMIRGKDITQ